MTSNESVNKCVRLAADSIERWGASPAQVESAIEKAVLLAVEEEREACASIAETIRARELARQSEECDGPFYDTIAEEIRDRIKMRPAASNSDWSELKTDS